MARLNHLIMVIPGLGGSVLRRNQNVVWNATIRSALARLARPGLLALDLPEVEADGLAGPFGINPFWAPFPGYDRLITMLSSPYRPGSNIDRGQRGQRNVLADIAAFPYDFRQSVSVTAALLAHDIRARQRARRQMGRPHRLIIVAHSLGGLVARHLLGHSEEMAASCDLLITLGTPHEGSPKALQLMVEGIHAFGRTWSGASSVLAAWPAMYEVLPRYRAVLDGRPDIGLPRVLHELTLPRLRRDLLEKSTTMHHSMDQGWATGGPAERVRHIPYVGVGQRTIEGATWDGTSLSYLREAPPWQPEGEVGGDGTVPARCAAPRDGDTSRIEAVSCRHGWLVEIGAIAARVERVTSGGPYYGANEVARWPHVLGLNLDKVTLVAGEPVGATVIVRGPDGEPVPDGRHSPSVRLRVAKEGRAWQGLALDPCGPGAWTVASAPLAAGCYQVEASAPHWLGRAQPPVQEVVAVVGDAEVERAAATEEGDQ